MVALKAIEYVTDQKGHKKKVVMDIGTFNNLQEGLEDLEDALALEKAKKQATGFKTWKDFLKEIGRE